MILTVQELAEREVHVADHVAEYLEACNRLFEEGILSHNIVSSSKQKILVNMKTGFEFFQLWKDLSQKFPGVYLEHDVMQLHVRVHVYNDYLSLYMCMHHADVKLRSPLQQNFLAWHLYPRPYTVLLYIMHYAY